MGTTWTVTITEVADGLWSVYGDGDNGDHMGSNVVGTQDDAVQFAAEQFPDATPTIKTL
jgi:hypothetical protein